MCYNYKFVKHVSQSGKQILAVLILSLFVSSWSWAQSVEVISRLNADTIQMGQQLQFELEVKVPQGFQVKWPVWKDTLATQIEIISQGKTENLPADKNGKIAMRQQLTITTFDTGWHYIPAIPVQFAAQDDTTFYSTASNPLMLRTLPVSVDTSSAFKPIKGPIAEPITFTEVLPYILGVLFLTVMLFVLWKLYKRHKNRVLPEAIISKPSIAPHILALNQLEELRHQKLWQKGLVKQYYTELSDIIRVYIEAQFPVNAVELTTYEIVSGLKPLKINNEAMGKLASTLELADLVKFAKAQPTSVENDLCISHLTDFVNESHSISQTFPMEEKIREEGL